MSTRLRQQSAPSDTGVSVIGATARMHEAISARTGWTEKAASDQYHSSNSLVVMQVEATGSGTEYLDGHGIYGKTWTVEQVGASPPILASTVKIVS